MAEPLLLLGATDLTRSVGDRLLRAGIAVAGVVSPPAEFSISYSAEPVTNSRFVDMEAWCRNTHVPFAAYREPDDIVAAARHGGAAAALLAGWYHMVPARVRAMFPRGCAAVHASLLPRYRGGAPLVWAMLRGDAEAGVSLFQLSDGVDDGPLYAQRRFPIDPEDYIADVVRKAELATLEMVTELTPALLAGQLESRPQHGEPSYALQRNPCDGRIDWRSPAAEIARLVRSTSRPYPGARAKLDGMPLTIWRARVAGSAPRVHGTAGQIASLPAFERPLVVTGAGLLLIEEVEGPDGFDVHAFGRRHQHRLDPISP